MIKSVLYTATATTSGGRTGTSATDDGRLSVILSSPKEMGGDGGPGTNPEQLFAMGYSACYLSALRYIARAQNVTVPDDTTIEAKVSIGPVAEGEGFGLAVELKIAIPGIDRERTLALMEAAHKVCPYSNATRGNIEVKLIAA